MAANSFESKSRRTKHKFIEGMNSFGRTMNRDEELTARRIPGEETVALSAGHGSGA